MRPVPSKPNPQYFQKAEVHDFSSIIGLPLYGNLDFRMESSLSIILLVWTFLSCGENHPEVTNAFSHIFFHLALAFVHCGRHYCSSADRPFCHRPSVNRPVLGLHALICLWYVWAMGPALGKESWGEV